MAHPIGAAPEGLVAAQPPLPIADRYKRLTKGIFHSQICKWNEAKDVCTLALKERNFWRRETVVKCAWGSFVFVATLLIGKKQLRKEGIFAVFLWSLARCVIFYLLPHLTYQAFVKRKELRKVDFIQIRDPQKRVLVLTDLAKSFFPFIFNLNKYRETGGLENKIIILNRAIDQVEEWEFSLSPTYQSYLILIKNITSKMPAALDQAAFTQQIEELKKGVPCQDKLFLELHAGDIYTCIAREGNAPLLVENLYHRYLELHNSSAAHRQADMDPVIDSTVDQYGEEALVPQEDIHQAMQARVTAKLEDGSRKSGVDQNFTRSIYLQDSSLTERFETIGGEFNTKESGRALILYWDQLDLSIKRDFIQRLGPEHLNEKDHLGRTPLIAAASSGELELVQALCDKGVFLNEVGRSGDTALMAAIGGNKQNVVAYLIDKKIKDGENFSLEVHQKNTQGETPLILAAIRGEKNWVECLLYLRADWAAVDNNQQSALTRAIIEKKKEVAGLLIEKAPPVPECLDLIDRAGMTPLMHAAVTGQLTLVKSLYNRGADLTLKNGDGKTALTLAHEAGHEQVVDHLASRMNPLNLLYDGGPTLLFWLIDQRKARIAKDLIEAAQNHASLRAADLMHAVETNQLSIVQALCATNAASILAGIKIALMAAHEQGHGAVANDLTMRMNPADRLDDLQRNTLLIWLIKNGKVDIVNALIGGLADANGLDETDATMKTALMHATEMGQLSVVRSLCNKGADVLKEDGAGKTALVLAHEADNEAVKDYLVGCMNLSNIVEREGYTLLMWLIDQKKTAIANRMIEELADAEGLDVIDATMKTALMHAAETGQLSVVESLCEKGADVMKRDRDGKTALELAKEANQPAVVKELIKRAKGREDTEIRAAHLLWAAENGEADLAAGLVEEIRIPTLRGRDEMRQAFILAAQKGHENVIEALLNAVKTSNEKVLADIKAINQDSVDLIPETIQGLKEAKSDLEIFGIAYLYASIEGHDQVKELLQEKSPIKQNRAGNILVEELIWAMSKGLDDEVHALLSSPQITLNREGVLGGTPLMRANELLDSKYFNLLLVDSRVNIWKKDQNGFSVLARAAKSKNGVNLNSLLARCNRTDEGFLSDEKELQGVEIAYIAANLDLIPSVDIRTTLRAMISEDRLEDTLKDQLLCAAECGSLPLVIELVERIEKEEAKTRKKQYWKKSARLCAERAGNRSVSEWLKCKGAGIPPEDFSDFIKHFVSYGLTSLLELCIKDMKFDKDTINYWREVLIDSILYGHNKQAQKIVGFCKKKADAQKNYRKATGWERESYGRYLKKDPKKKTPKEETDVTLDDLITGKEPSEKTSALSEAMKRDNSQLVEFLLSYIEETEDSDLDQALDLGLFLIASQVNNKRKGDQSLDEYLKVKIPADQTLGQSFYKRSEDPKPVERSLRRDLRALLSK